MNPAHFQGAYAETMPHRNIDAAAQLHGEGVGARRYGIGTGEHRIERVGRAQETLDKGAHRTPILQRAARPRDIEGKARPAHERDLAQVYAVLDVGLMFSREVQGETEPLAQDRK